MSVVSVEEAEARRQSWREDVQWNIARRDEAFRLADSIVGEGLVKDLARLRTLADKADHSYGEDYDRNRRYYLKELRRIAEQSKGKLPALRKLWKALEELPLKPKHLTGLNDAGVDLRWEVTWFMRAVFAAEMGLHVSQRAGGWPSKLALALDRSCGADGSAHYRDHPFELADARGAFRAEIWEPSLIAAERDHGFLKALAGGLDLECVLLPATMGMWFPGRTVPVVFYQRESIYRAGIEAAIERMMQELSPQ
jgi:hypothetical protein